LSDKCKNVWVRSDRLRASNNSLSGKPNSTRVKKHWLKSSEPQRVRPSSKPREAEGSRSWRPYTNGRWVYTDAGWTWISEEPFGWATYHYGRWARLRNIGWIWVSGDEWAPAWVSWRKSNDYVGWRRCLALIGVPVFITGLTTITTSAQTNTVSFRGINLARAVLRQPWFRPNAT
jgi:hypothetical protein